jgi:acyl carrier protein
MGEQAQQIRTFIIENFLFGQAGDGLADADSFLDKGIIDSTGMLELVAFLEKTYGIKVHDEEFVPENLDSICNLVGFLRRKQAEGGA